MTYTKHKCNNALLPDNKGAAAIEYAILLPMFVILSLAVIEFGMYFVKSEMTNSAVSTVSQTIQRNPGYYSSLTPVQLQAELKSYGSGLIDFSKPSNYICVDAYTTAAQAQSAAACTSSYFNTTNPNGASSTTPYYIAVRADLQKALITPLGNFLPAVKNIQINQSSGAVLVGNQLPPVCYNPWERITFNNGTYSCPLTSYTVAGEVYKLNDATHPGFTPTSLPYSSDYNQMVCTTVNFTVPAGLPPGQLVPSGNVTDWTTSGYALHNWIVTFIGFNPPMGGGTTSFAECIYTTYKPVDPAKTTDGESWTVTYIPSSR
jgi:Flp pilus assembly protein TadG